ncbi:radical SAM protein [Geomonas oryzisoli]|uniref:Radical SAM protein n=1 Tax=Geomonas oryzisoli TaxID=2847992 RepID=A0ABX8J753_9BACT|nr:radical SAM protein [Geomonas oryzisoli]QWV93643.1 radical SAM protein [Geomonas oryzisoli]
MFSRPTTGTVIPQSINIELTNSCNLKCITCSHKYSNYKIGFMDPAKAKALIDSCAPHVRYICLTVLGETYLYPHLVEILDYIRQADPRIDISLATNATLPNTVPLTMSILDKVDHLMISMDGAAQTYSRVRNSDFDNFLGNLARISEAARPAGADIYLNFVVLEENYRELPEVVQIAHRYQVGLRLSPINLVSLPEKVWDGRIYRFYESEGFKAVLAETLALAQNLGVRIPSGPFTERPKRIHECIFLRDGFTVLWDGTVPLCCNTNHVGPSFGNAFDSGLIACVNSDLFNSVRNSALSGNVPQYCKRCGDYNYEQILAEYEAGLKAGAVTHAISHSTLTALLDAARRV